MEGPVTWAQLYFVVGITVIANVSTAGFVGWLVWRVCKIVSDIETRLTRIEDELDAPTGASKPHARYRLRDNSPR